MKHPLLTEEQVRFWFERMREYDITVLEQRKRLIDTFVNAIFVYNDRLLFTFNYKRDAKTVLFSDLKSSDITKGVRPYRVFITDLSYGHSIFVYVEAGLCACSFAFSRLWRYILACIIGIVLWKIQSTMKP